MKIRQPTVNREPDNLNIYIDSATKKGVIMKEVVIVSACRTAVGAFGGVQQVRGHHGVKIDAPQFHATAAKDDHVVFDVLSGFLNFRISKNLPQSV